MSAAGEALVAFSPAMAAADTAIKGFLFPRMYREPRVMRIRREADGVVRRLFARLMEAPELMPEGWRKAAGEGDRARAVSDYIAGMTDRYALAEHRRLFDESPDLR